MVFFKSQPAIPLTRKQPMTVGRDGPLYLLKKKTIAKARNSGLFGGRRAKGGIKGSSNHRCTPPSSPSHFFFGRDEQSPPQNRTVSWSCPRRPRLR